MGSDPPCTIIRVSISMHFDQQFKKIADIDVSELKSLVNTLTQEQWDQHSLRQEIFDVHSHTETIPLIFDQDFRHRFQTVQPAFTLFEQSLQPIMSAIKKYFLTHTPTTKGDRPNRVEKGYFVRIILVKLSAKGEINPHKDHGYSLSRAHRLHLPIITNDKVEFTIDGVTKNLAEGELYEINNRGLHSVKNLSNSARVHLILDFVIPDEIIEDPINGTLYA